MNKTIPKNKASKGMLIQCQKAQRQSIKRTKKHARRICQYDTECQNKTYQK